MDEPAYRVWMQDSVPPERALRRASGPLGGRAVLALARHRGAGLRADPRPADRAAGCAGARSRSPCARQQFLGMAARPLVRLRAERRCALGPARRRRPGGLLRDGAAARAPGDPGRAGARPSSCRVDRPNALLCARLCDVAPDGASLRVSYGLLNLTHRDGHEHPEPLEPGRRYPVRLQLNDAAHAFPAGHRIRLALSTDLLADRLALARGGDRHGVDRRQPARAAGPCRATARMPSWAVRRRRKARRRSPRRPCARQLRAQLRL